MLLLALRADLLAVLGLYVVVLRDVQLLGAHLDLRRAQQAQHGKWVGGRPDGTLAATTCLAAPAAAVGGPRCAACRMLATGHRHVARESKARSALSSEAASVRTGRRSGWLARVLGTHIRAAAAGRTPPTDRVRVEWWLRSAAHPLVHRAERAPVHVARAAQLLQARLQLAALALYRALVPHLCMGTTVGDRIKEREGVQRRKRIFFAGGSAG